MALSVTYATVNGRVLQEVRGGVVNTYMRDPLGNTIGLLNSAGVRTDSWTYWPYGEIASHSGTSTTPLTFLGTLGYFIDYANKLYVRARHLRADLTRWLIVDKFWPSQLPYSYASLRPSQLSDESGNAAISQSDPSDRLLKAFNNVCGVLKRLSSGSGDTVSQGFNACVEGTGCPSMSDSLSGCMSRLCDWQYPVAVNSDCDPDCKGNCGYTRGGRIFLCSDSLGKPGCNHFRAGAPYSIVLIHELLHRCGIEHPTGLKILPESKCNNIMACCLLKAGGLLPGSVSCRPPGGRAVL